MQLTDTLGREADSENKHGFRDRSRVSVYRPESEVFKADSLASYIAEPVTIDHPSVAVAADNWREYVALAVGALNTSLADAQTKVGTLTADLATATTTIQTKDGEIAALTAKLADAEVTPAKLEQLADARADVIVKAKTLAPNIVVDGKTDVEIRKEAVATRLGDARDRGRFHRLHQGRQAGGAWRAAAGFAGRQQ